MTPLTYKSWANQTHKGVLKHECFNIVSISHHQYLKILLSSTLQAHSHMTQYMSV